jgi:hypothetical protein
MLQTHVCDAAIKFDDEVKKAENKELLQDTTEMVDLKYKKFNLNI